MPKPVVFVCSSEEAELRERKRVLLCVDLSVCVPRLTLYIVSFVIIIYTARVESRIFCQVARVSNEERLKRERESII